MLDNTPMQNQQCPPYHIPGRWYRFYITSDGSTLTLAEADIPAMLTNPSTICTLNLGKKFHVIKWVWDIHTAGNQQSQAKDYAPSMRTYPDGSQQIRVGVADQYDYATFYVFGYIE